MSCVVVSRYILIPLLLIQLIAGKSIDFSYQEIDNEASKSPGDIDHIKYVQLDTSSKETMKKICDNCNVMINFGGTDPAIKCHGVPSEQLPTIKIIKRQVAENKEESEGSGDIEQPPEENIDDQTQLTEGSVEISKMSEATPGKIEITEGTQSQLPQENIVDVTSQSTEIIVTTEQTTLDEKPQEAYAPVNAVTFKPGFENILAGTPVQRNNILRGSENGIASINSERSGVNQGDEIAKAGESKEEPNAALPNSALMIAIAALGVIGVLAFAFSYIKKRRDDRVADEVMRLDSEGRELKEIKPLMKNSLAQNGSRSLEYIDAEPQNGYGTETKVELNRDQDFDRHSQ